MRPTYLHLAAVVLLFGALAFALAALLVYPASGEPAPLASYLDAAMTAWVPPAAQPEGEDAAKARYAAIAQDVAAVVSDPDEPPLFEGDNDRHRTALLLLSIASYESSFFARVDEGRCLPRECDAGHAFGLFQVQPARGIALDGDGWRYDSRGFHGRDMVRDRRIAIRVALHLARGPHDPRWTGGDRTARADTWAAAHPFAP